MMTKKRGWMAMEGRMWTQGRGAESSSRETVKGELEGGREVIYPKCAKWSGSLGMHDRRILEQPSWETPGLPRRRVQMGELTKAQTQWAAERPGRGKLL